MSDTRVRVIVEAEIEEFKKLTTHYIGLWYDDIDESFAQIIVDAHKKGFDPIGYFTKNKTIWVLECNGEMYGFLVATEKRGGSVKLAPGIMKPEYQRKKYGTFLWKSVENIYRDKGARKIYNHAPLRRVELLRWVTSMGLNIEGYLKEQYRKGQDEYVAGKFLRETDKILHPIVTFSGNDVPYEIREYNSNNEHLLRELILEEMPRWYNDIDESFFESVLKAEKRFHETYKKKGKKVFVIEGKDHLIGCCIATPKRGGAVKLTPFLTRPNDTTLKMSEGLLIYVEEYFKEMGYRKLYAPVPTLDISCCETFRKCKFEIEGLIKEPYKDSVDNFIFGRIIEEST